MFTFFEIINFCDVLILGLANVDVDSTLLDKKSQVILIFYQLFKLTLGINPVQCLILNISN